MSKIRRSMAENGSSPSAFEFDEARTYFRVTLPAHPEHVPLTLLRDYAYKKATGSEREARSLLEQAWREGPRSPSPSPSPSPSLAVALVRELIQQRDRVVADRLIGGIDQADVGAYARALTTLASAHADSENEPRSKMLSVACPIF